MLDSDIIIRGQEPTSASELEAVLLEHPAVAEALVVGVPHLTLGEEIVALVVLHRSWSLEPDEITTYMRRRCEPNDYPRVTLLVNALPADQDGPLPRDRIDLVGLFPDFRYIDGFVD